MRLLQRYLLRQHAGPFVFALSALTGIMLLNQVARRFDRLVGKGLEWSVIAEVFVLSIPFIVAMTLPMAVLLAVLYAFSQLAADSEITAMRASGVSVGQLLAPMLFAGAALSLTNFVFVDQVLPRSNARLRTLLWDIGRKKPTLDLHEQAINEIPPSRLFLRAGRIDQAKGRLKDVVLYDLTNQSGPTIIYADSGRMAMTENLEDLQLRLNEGEVHEYDAQEPRNFRVTAFTTNTILVRDVSNQLERGTSEAMRGDREQSTCEMQDVVRQAQREAALAQRDRTRMLRNDLRALLGLPRMDRLGGPPPSLAPRVLCDWWERALSAFVPKTAEAQAVTQDTTPRQDTLPRRLLKKRPRLPQKMVPRRDTVRSPTPPAGTPRPPLVRGRPRAERGSSRVLLTAWSEVSSSKEVRRAAIERADSYLVEIHKKWSISVACLVFVLVGIPMALRFPRGGMGLVIGGGLSVFSIYYVGLTAGESLADLGRVPPWLPMWAPNIILFIAGVVGLSVIRRHSGTARGGDMADLWETLVGLVRRRTAS